MSDMPPVPASKAVALIDSYLRGEMEFDEFESSFQEQLPGVDADSISDGEFLMLWEVMLQLDLTDDDLAFSDRKFGVRNEMEFRVWLAGHRRSLAGLE